MNDHLTYWILPNEQRIVGQLIQYQEIVAEYERINKQNTVILETMIKNQADIISKHTEKLELYEDYIQKIKNNQSIEKDSLLKLTNNNNNIKQNAIKKVYFKE